MEATLDICRAKYQKHIPTPILKFRQLGRTAGVCDYSLNDMASTKIVINPDFFKNHYDDMMNDTVPHEVAHYIAVFIHGRAGHGHGWLWKNVMAVVGISGADRCHQYSLEGVKARNMDKPYKYSCGCDGERGVHMLTKTKHKRHQDSVTMTCKGYICRRCRGSLTYEGFTIGGQYVPAKKPFVVQPTTVPVVEIHPKTVIPIQMVPIPLTETEGAYRMMTRFVNGSLVNVKVPVMA